MGKRKAEDADGGDPMPSGGAPTVGQQTSFIKNKVVRSMRYQKLKHENNKKKKAERKKREKELARAEDLGLEPPPKKVPKVGLRLHQPRQCWGR